MDAAIRLGDAAMISLYTLYVLLWLWNSHVSFRKSTIGSDIFGKADPTFKVKQKVLFENQPDIA